MECPNCQKTFWRNVKVIGKNGLERRISFCCYECYLEFWKNVEGFIPLSNAESVIAPEPIKKKRIQLKKHISYNKNEYCF